MYPHHSNPIWLKRKFINEKHSHQRFQIPHFLKSNFPEPIKSCPRGCTKLIIPLFNCRQLKENVFTKYFKTVCVDLWSKIIGYIPRANNWTELLLLYSSALRWTWTTNSDFSVFYIKLSKQFMQTIAILCWIQKTKISKIKQMQPIPFSLLIDADFKHRVICIIVIDTINSH